MTRREIRENIFKMLFRIEFHEKGEMPEQFSMYEEELSRADEEELRYINEKVQNIVEHLEEIDASVNEGAEGWKTTRMGKVDLTLIRLAVYEIRYEEDIPFKVSVNEAVLLAKKYGGDGSSVFVNGILAKYA